MDDLHGETVCTPVACGAIKTGIEAGAIDILGLERRTPRSRRFV